LYSNPSTHNYRIIKKRKEKKNENHIGALLSSSINSIYQGIAALIIFVLMRGPFQRDSKPTPLIEGIYDFNCYYQSGYPNRA
jgi:hypothetical protein